MYTDNSILTIHIYGTCVPKEGKKQQHTQKTNAPTLLHRSKQRLTVFSGAKPGCKSISIKQGKKTRWMKDAQQHPTSHPGRCAPSMAMQH
jgi:hypothetical protein